MFGFSFLFPAFLIGSAAIAVPIVLHLMRRETAPLFQFSAVRFLQRVPVEQARRRRLRELLLLALRVAALLLLAVAFRTSLSERVQRSRSGRDGRRGRHLVQHVRARAIRAGPGSGARRRRRRARGASGERRRVRRCRDDSGGAIEQSRRRTDRHREVGPRIRRDALPPRTGARRRRDRPARRAHRHRDRPSAQWMGSEGMKGPYRNACRSRCSTRSPRVAISR